VRLLLLDDDDDDPGVGDVAVPLPYTGRKRRTMNGRMRHALSAEG
jgi:hypothetical protein